MSFSGYYQCLCENGHLSNVDAIAYSTADLVGEELFCYQCKTRFAFTNLVDTTNECHGYFPLGKFLLKPAVVEKCNLNHMHVVEPATYKIPSSEDIKKYRK